MNTTSCTRCEHLNERVRSLEVQELRLRDEIERLARVLQAHGIADAAVDALEEAEAEAESDARAEAFATYGARHWRSAPYVTAAHERD